MKSKMDKARARALKKIKPTTQGDRAGVKERYEIFARAYAGNGRNATQAAITAGYSPHSSGQIGRDLLEIPQIKKMIGDYTAELMRTVIMTGQQAMARIQEIGTYDPRRIFDKDGNVLPPAKWPDDIAFAIAGFDVREIYHPVTGRKTGYVKKVKWKDSLRAVEDVAKHKGALQGDGADVDVNVTVVNENEVRKMREKIKSDC